MTFLSDGIDWIDSMRKSHFSVQVDYVRGTKHATILATFGSTDTEETEDGEVVVQSKATDFIFTADDLNFGGGPDDPAIGDHIKYVSSGTEFDYIVVELAGSGHFRPLDGRSSMIRVHTKLFRKESVA